VLEDGEPVGMISSRDILASKLQEANEALARSAEEVERARGAKDEILANISHELRTPLNGILGMTELVMETSLDESQKEYLEVVRQSAEELDTIIGALLDFAGIDTGRELVNETTFCLPELLRTTLTVLGQRAENEGLDFHLDMDELPEKVIGDPGRLCQVLSNVIGNAIKFTPSGRVEVSVDTLSQSSEYIRVGFTVKDSGKGIPPEKLQEIFDAFRQVDGSHTREFGGTGLGLAIASRIVHLMGGEISASSRVGEGSRFHFTARFALANANGEANRPLTFRPDNAVA
jgi:signal transduction histidine kinase